MMFCRLSLVTLLAVAVSAPWGLPVMLAQTDSPGNALFAAIQRGAVGDVERLLRTGTNPNVVDADGIPALMTATVFADAEMVDVLLKHGADPNRAGPAGATALLWAVPDVEKVRLLVARGANVNARSETDRTPLLVAASYPRTVTLLRLLLDRGADLRAQDRGGATALSLAIRSADVEVVQFLVEKGLDPSALSPAARRVGLARYDLPTTDFLLAKAATPATRRTSAAKKAGSKKKPAKAPAAKKTSPARPPAKRKAAPAAKARSAAGRSGSARKR